MREIILLQSDAARMPFDSDAAPPRPVVTVKESDKKIDLSYVFDGFIRSDRPLTVDGRKLEFQTTEIPGTGYVVESGKPLLPSFRRFVQVPPGTDYKLRATMPGKAVEIRGLTIAPAQAKLTDAPEPVKVEFDRGFYGSDELYPKEIAKATGPYFIDGCNVLLVEVFPLQYNPRKKLLIGHPRIDVSIELKAGRDTGARANDDPRQSRRAFRNLMLNPRTTIPKELAAPLGPELLIYYAASFGDAARKLAQWKNQRGLLTELALVDPGWTNEDLKTDIRHRRAGRSRLRYVLLFGDVGDIPTEVVAHPYGTNITDYYYSTPDGPTASVPVPQPWLSLGRIPARDTAEAMSVVDQIIAYEKNPPADAAYYRRYICAAYYEGTTDHRGYMLTMERIHAFLTSISYNPERVYVSDNPNPATFMDGSPVPPEVKAAFLTPAAATQRLIDATTTGQLIMAHRDHGAETGWSNPPFNVADLNKVTGTMPSIFYSLNCLTGAWQGAHPPGPGHPPPKPECFAEVVLNKPGTAPTLIAATNVSNTYLNNSMMLALFDGMYGGLLPTFPDTTFSAPIRCNRIGDMLNYSRSYLLSKEGATDEVRKHCEIYHVVGDPSLEVWDRVPQPLSVQATLASRALTIQLSALPPDCTVTIWHGDTMLFRDTPQSARFTLPLPVVPHPVSLQPTYLICAKAPGFRYVETKVKLPLLVHVPEKVKVPVHTPVSA